MKINLYTISAGVGVLASVFTVAAAGIKTSETIFASASLGFVLLACLGHTYLRDKTLTMINLTLGSCSLAAFGLMMIASMALEFY